VHANGNAEHGAHGDKVSTDVAVGDGAVVGTPVVHDVVSGLEGGAFLAVATGGEPGAGPGGVGAHEQGVGNVVGELDGPAFGDLEDRAETLDQVQTDHGSGHFGTGGEGGGEAAATEIAVVGCGPGGGLGHLLDILVGDFPPLSHDAVAVFVLAFAAGVKGGSAGVDKVDKAAVLFGLAFDLVAGGTLGGLGGPVGADVGEHLGAVGEKLHEQHAKTVENVVLGGKNVGLTGAVVVEGGVEQSFGEVAVGIEVGPLTLTLEAAGDGVVTDHLFFAAGRQVGIAVEHILDDAVHLCKEVPLLFLLVGGSSDELGVLVPALFAVLFDPCSALCDLFGVVDALGHSAEDFNLVNGLNAHTEVGLDKVGVDNGAADTHADGADLQVGLAAHGGNGNCGAGETEELFLNVGGNVGYFVKVLNVVAVNAEGGKTLLGVGSENGRQVNSAGTLGAVEAPNALDGLRIHVHGLRAVAPAGCDGEGDVDAVLLELFGAGGSLGNAADGGVCDYDLNRIAVGILKVFLKQLLGGLCHCHGLVFEAFANLEGSTATVDGGADTDNRIVTDISVLRHNKSSVK